MTLTEVVVSVALIFLFLFFATFFLRLGASVAGVPQHRNTMGRALLILLLSWLVYAVLGGGGHAMAPGVGTLAGLLGLVATVFIIGSVFDVPLGKAIITYLFTLIFQILFPVLVVFLLGVLGISVQWIDQALGRQ